MQLRSFGSTGLAVSPIGFGTVKLGRDKAMKYPVRYTIPDDRTARSLLAVASELGINLLDTAPAYGSSEARLGGLLKGQRDRWVICTKAGEEFDNDTGKGYFDFSPEHIRFSVERSLRRLGIDVIDILLIHSDGNDVYLIEELGVLDVLGDLKREGKIRAAGMSGKTVEGGRLALEHSDCAMVTYNLGHDAEVPVIDDALRLGRGILVKKALASGHFAAEAGGDPIEQSLARVFSHPGVHSAVLGTISADHLRANVAAGEKVLADLQR